MASNIPAQLRTVDPYASYNSNVVNSLTGIVTRGSNVLDYYNSLQVVSDSTSPLTHVVVMPGIVYKDDMLIEITAQHTVDIMDGNQYITAPHPFVLPNGIYYLVLQYTYAKSRPAPQATIKLLLPAQTPSFASSTDLVFLKAIRISNASQSIVLPLYDYDPDFPVPPIQREYVKTYASSDVFLPTFDQDRDQGRFTYVPEENTFYLGYEDGWENADSGAIFEADTSGFSVGDLVYISALNTLTLAISTSQSSTADGVVTKAGVNGTVQVAGVVSGVTTNTVAVGDLLYLSSSIAGAVTNVKPVGFSQFVGRVETVTDPTTADIIFVRGDPDRDSEYTVTLASGGSWLGVPGAYYQDVDISASEMNAEQCVIGTRDASNGRVIVVNEIDVTSSTLIRIYMVVNTVSVIVSVSG